jgi:predicted CXXCH cytochrome family protein
MRHLAGKVLVFIGVAVFSLASTAHAQLTSVIKGGPHDLTTGSALTITTTTTANTAIDGQTCIFCHAPHGGGNNTPLWNRGNPATGYQVYTSTSSVTAETASGIQTGPSGACLSCHDGTIAVDVLTNVNGLAFAGGASFTKAGTAKATSGATGGGANDLMTGGLPFLGSDMRNDHPVAIVYNTAYAASSKSGQYVTPSTSGTVVTVGTQNLPLYGGNATTATVECSSCHNSHDNHLGNFLRVKNTGSQMCLSCHIK